MSAGPTSGPLTDESDWDLVVAAKNGKDRAIEILIKRYEARMLSLALSLLELRGELTAAIHLQGLDREGQPVQQGLQKACSRQRRVSVADMGIGLQPENVEQIFSAFFTSKSQGTGMGCRLAGRLSNRTVVACGRPLTAGQVRHFSSSCRSKSPRTQLYSQRLREDETAISVI